MLQAGKSRKNILKQVAHIKSCAKMKKKWHEENVAQVMQNFTRHIISEAFFFTTFSGFKVYIFTCLTQRATTWSKLTIETLERGVKYVQS